MIEMLGRSNILAIVSAHPDKVTIWDDAQKAVIAQFSFESKVLAIKMRKEMIVIATDRQTFIYNFKDF